jgi:hypothetical protein
MGDGYRAVTDSTGAVEVDGLKELIRSLRRAGDDLADLKDANQAAATIALRGAEELVPYRTGKLAGTGRTAKQAGRARFQFGSARVPYARIVHWGWPARGIPAQTYGTDGARRTEPVWSDTYAKALQAICDTVKGA